jgi:predicted O-methyltransferase YrrM
MAFDPVDPRAERYLRELATRHDEPVLLEMEQLAETRSFPIVGRLVGPMLEALALMVGARTVIELGSGFGYSAYWFTRAVGPGGRVVCTDGDPANRDLAEGFLTRAGRWDRVDFRVGMAQDVLRALPEPVDVVYNDIDKHDYPEAWELARTRIRPGGLYLCDNVLWSGRVAEQDPNDQHPESTAAIRRHNELVAADPDFDSFIVPTRDGVMVARRR